MPSKNQAQRLRDILDNIDAVRSFTAGMDIAGFMRDPKTVYAVTRALEIVSEASHRLPDEIKERHPEIDWWAVAAAGNIYRHEYEAVDESQLWETVQHGLSALRAAIAAELNI